MNIIKLKPTAIIVALSISASFSLVADLAAIEQVAKLLPKEEGEQFKQHILARAQFDKNWKKYTDRCLGEDPKGLTARQKQEIQAACATERINLLRQQNALKNQRIALRPILKKAKALQEAEKERQEAEKKEKKKVLKIRFVPKTELEE